jgi:hypothetical protein
MGRVTSEVWEGEDGVVGRPEAGVAAGVGVRMKGRISWLSSTGSIGMRRLRR